MRTVLSYNLNESHIRAAYKLFTEAILSRGLGLFLDSLSGQSLGLGSLIVLCSDPFHVSVINLR